MLELSNSVQDLTDQFTTLISFLQPFFTTDRLVPLKPVSPFSPLSFFRKNNNIKQKVDHLAPQLKSFLKLPSSLRKESWSQEDGLHALEDQHHPQLPSFSTSCHVWLVSPPGGGLLSFLHLEASVQIPLSLLNFLPHDHLLLAWV